MARYNRKCFYCGEPYYCCSSCIAINSWKNTYCSTDCFIKSQESGASNIKPIVINKGDVYMKAVIKKNGKTINITGYDLDMGKFDCSDDKTRMLADFDYFIITADEMQDLTVKKEKSKNDSSTKSTKNATKSAKSERIVVDLPRK